jgi:hypothetical protein
MRAQDRWMMILGGLLALTGMLATAVPSSAAQLPTGSAPSSLTRLSEADVRVLFSKNLIIRPGAPEHLGNISDEFTAKGSYFQSGRRIPLMGSYAIRGDLVCVDEGPSAPEKCRAIYRSPDGELWETYAFEGTATVIGLVRIQVERTATTLKGM